MLLLPLLCLGVSCSGTSDIGCNMTGCFSWSEARKVIAVADSLDQAEHVIYSDTIALGRTIRSLDNPFGRLFMRNTLGKAYYYMGRNYIADGKEGTPREQAIEQEKRDRNEVNSIYYENIVREKEGYPQRGYNYSAGD